MFWHIALIILGLSAIAGIVFLFRWHKAPAYGFETVCPILVGLVIAVYVGWSFGLRPMLDANQYAQWLNTPLTLPAYQTWVGTDNQGLPLRVTLTPTGQPAQWQGTFTSGNFLTNSPRHIYAVHLAELLDRHAGTAAVSGTVGKYPLAGTIRWAQVRQNIWGFTAWHTLPESQWTWQGTIGGVPYHLGN